MKPIEGLRNAWHTEHEGDPYFLYVVAVDRAWRVVRQVNMGEVYRAHTVTEQRSGKMLCDCEGFHHAHKCRHVDMVRQLKETSGS